MKLFDLSMSAVALLVLAFVVYFQVTGIGAVVSVILAGGWLLKQAFGKEDV